jgi:hypothetical protein
MMEYVFAGLLAAIALGAGIWAWRFENGGTDTKKK